MNPSHLTRKEQILAVLTERAGAWVDGSDLATESVGGSEGLRRLRELCDEGQPIEKRRHPDPERDIWQYRLAQPRPVTPPSRWRCTACQSVTTAEPNERVLAGHWRGRCFGCSKTTIFTPDTGGAR